MGKRTVIRLDNYDLSNQHNCAQIIVIHPKNSLNFRECSLKQSCILFKHSKENLTFRLKRGGLEKM